MPLGVSLPICENFLGGLFKAWFQSEDRQNFASANADFRGPAVAYAIVNDLSDETRDELIAWAKGGFLHVCGKPNPNPELPFAEWEQYV